MNDVYNGEREHQYHRLHEIPHPLPRNSKLDYSATKEMPMSNDDRVSKGPGRDGSSAATFRRSECLCLLQSTQALKSVWGVCGTLCNPRYVMQAADDEPRSDVK